MKTILLIVIIFFILSCNSDNNDTVDTYNYSTAFHMRVVNEQGEDLLNPEHPNAVDYEQIKLYYVINEQPVEVFNPAMDSPRNFNIEEYTEEGIYKMNIFPNINSTNTITYIDWNDSDRDTINCEIIFSENSTVLKRVWYNGELKVDVPAGTGYTFEVIK